MNSPSITTSDKTPAPVAPSTPRRRAPAPPTALHPINPFRTVTRLYHHNTSTPPELPPPRTAIPLFPPRRHTALSITHFPTRPELIPHRSDLDSDNRRKNHPLFDRNPGNSVATARRKFLPQTNHALGRARFGHRQMTLNYPFSDSLPPIVVALTPNTFWPFRNRSFSQKHTSPYLHGFFGTSRRPQKRHPSRPSPTRAESHLTPTILNPNWTSGIAPKRHPAPG